MRNSKTKNTSCKSIHEIDFMDLNAIHYFAKRNILPLLQRIFPDGEIRGSHYLTRNPNHKKRSLGSFSINMKNSEWIDFATEDKGTDIISLCAFVLNITQHEAIQCLHQMFMGRECKKHLFTPLTKAEKSIPWPLHGRTIHPKLSPSEENWTPLAYSPFELFEKQGLAARPDPMPTAWEGYTFKAWYPYFNEEVSPYFVALMQNANGKEKKATLSYGICEGQKGWHWKKPLRRVLFNLVDLISFPGDEKVIIVQDEETAIAAEKLYFLNTVFTTCGGRQFVSMVDWSPLKKRDVLILSRNNKAERKYAQEVMQQAYAAGASSIVISSPPKGFPEKCDPTDPFILSK